MTTSPSLPYLDLSIILPTKDRHFMLFKTLRSLLDALQDLTCEVLIIDNSTTTEIELPEDLRRDFISIRKNPGNRNSVFASRNYGATIARSEHLLFLDDDILVTPESLKFAVVFQRASPGTASNVNWKYPVELLEKMSTSVFGRFLIHAGYTTMRELHGTRIWENDQLFESGVVASFFLCINRKNFLESGGYEERHLHEGTDMSLIENLKRNGIKMYTHSGILVYHNEEDRIEIRNWMGRKKRLGAIIANSSTIGDTSEEKLNYSILKSALLSSTYALRTPLIFFITNFLHRIRVLDKFRFKFISLLARAYVYKGYTTQLRYGKKG